jgi:Methyltransferase domain
MAQASNVSLAPGDLRRHARERWRQDRPRDALDLTWAAFDLAPDERATRLLQHYPIMLDAHRQEAYLGLLTDQRVAPDEINIAGWELLLRNYRLFENATDASHEALIEDLERNELALTLLRESPVSLVAAERLLTAVRRWLLLSKRWQHYPKLMTALQVQASLNGGAWPFDDVERARLAEERCNSVTAVYFPIRAAEKNLSTLATDDPITFAVATQYEGWPYPAWTRVTVGNATQLPAVIRAIDHESAETLPIEANMLIAGCGTGRQAATIALCYPDATITAIDLSQASLDYARRQCAALGIVNVRFIKLDLHESLPLISVSTPSIAREFCTTCPIQSVA